MMDLLGGEADGAIVVFNCMATNYLLSFLTCMNDGERIYSKNVKSRRINVPTRSISIVVVHFLLCDFL